MSVHRAKMSGGCQGTDRPVRGGLPPGSEDQEAGGPGSEMMLAKRAYRLFLIERHASWPETEELRLYFRRHGWTVLATGGLPFTER